MILSFELMMLGIFTLIYIIVSLFVGLKIMAKYFEIKDKILLYCGLSYLGIAIPWMGVALNFISIVFFNTIPSMELHFFVHGAIPPLTLWLWIVFNLKLSYIRQKIQKMIISISFIIAIIFQIIYIYIIITDTMILGTLINEIQVDYSPFSELYLLIMAIIMISLGFSLGFRSLKSDNKRIRLKGKLIISSFLLACFAYALEIFVPVIAIIILARILVMFTAILFYGGYILPKWMEKLFLKEGE